jgi:hypothetical protein
MAKFLEGKKTYLVMACIIIFGALDAWNEYCGNGSCKVIEIPTFVFSLLGFLGIYTRKVAK